MTREEAIIDLNALKFILDNDQYTDEIEEALDTAISALQQPEPKKGKWERTYRNGFGTLIGRCGVCGRTQTVDNFCQNCGARLEEAECG